MKKMAVPEEVKEFNKQVCSGHSGFSVYRCARVSFLRALFPRALVSTSKRSLGNLSNRHPFYNIRSLFVAT